MHIESYTSGNNIYIRLAKGIFVPAPNGKMKLKKKILVNLGNIKKYDDGQPNFLERLRESFAKGHPLIEELLPFVSDLDQQPMDNTQYLEPKNIGYMVLDAFFDGLEISSVLTRHKSRYKLSCDLLGIAKLLVFNRILFQQPKKKAIKNRDVYALPIAQEADDHELSEALKEIGSAKRALLHRLNTVISRKKKNRHDLSFYYVTSHYWDCEHTQEFLASEHEPLAKHQSSGKGILPGKQNLIQMGLFLDQEGVPFSYDLYPGNTLNHMDVGLVLESLKKTPKPRRIIVVANQDSISCKNMNVLPDYGYVMRKNFQNFSMEEKNWAVNNLNVRGDSYGELRFKSRVITKQMKDCKGSTVHVRQKQIVFWSHKIYKRESKWFEYFLNMIKDYPEESDCNTNEDCSSLSNMIQGSITDGSEITSNEIQAMTESMISKDNIHFGYYMIVSSEVDKTNEEIIDLYLGLSKIETYFRPKMNDYRSLSEYVPIEQQMEAHFLFGFLSLTIIRLIQRILIKANGRTYSSPFAWEERMNWNRIHSALSTHFVNLESDETYRTTRPADDLRIILRALRVLPLGAMCTYSDLIQYKNNLKRNVTCLFNQDPPGANR